MTIVNLSDQASFADFFKKFAAGEIPDNVTIKFKQPKAMQETPFLRIGDAEHDGTINASVMRALLVHQTNINRLYSFIIYGKGQKLKLADAKALQISFRVSKGSLEISIEDVARVLAIILPMLTGGQITVALIAIAVAGLFFYFSTGMIINYTNKYFDLEKRRIEADVEKTRIEADLEKRRIEANVEKRRIEVDVEKMRIEHKFILDAIKELKDGDKITKGAQNSLNEFKKISRQEKSIEYLGHKISPNTKNIIPKK